MGNIVQWYNPFHVDSDSRNFSSELLVHELQFSIPLALHFQLFIVLSCDLHHWNESITVILSSSEAHRRKWAWASVPWPVQVGFWLHSTILHQSWCLMQFRGVEHGFTDCMGCKVISNCALMIESKEQRGKMQVKQMVTFQLLVI